jgi:hypothetical protein
MPMQLVLDCAAAGELAMLARSKKSLAPVDWLNGIAGLPSVVEDGILLSNCG